MKKSGNFLYKPAAKQYNRFIRHAAKFCSKYAWEHNFIDSSAVLMFLMKSFNFSFVVVDAENNELDFSVKDKDLRELFCRRMIDDLPWDRPDKEDDCCKDYLDFFTDFCYEYRKYAFKRYSIKLKEETEYLNKILEEDDDTECVSD